MYSVATQEAYNCAEKFMTHLQLRKPSPMR
jgi:hypothetical protein